MSLLEKIKLLEKKKDNPDQLSLDLDGADDKRSKAQKFTDKINKKNKNRKEFEFDPKTKERQTFKGKITSGPRKGEGYTIFRRDGGDVKKGVDKGVLPKAAKGDPIDVKSPAHKDLFKRYNKGEPKATQFMIDLAKDDRKARGLGKRAERVKDASGGKKTGSLRKGNLSFPGDRTGAYSRTKSEIEFNKALKKARGNTEGDLPKETPQSVRDYAKKVRDKRIKKYKLPDTSFDAKPSKKPIRPFGDAPVKTGIDKPTVPKKKTFKVFSQGTKKKAIDDIRASDKRLYDAGVGKKPSLVQQRKFAKAAFKKAQQKQTAEFNKQQRLYRQYDAYDDGDLGNPEFTKKNLQTKKVRQSSGIKTEIPSGSPEMGGESKKFASRNRTPAPQIKPTKKSKTPPPLNKSTAKLDTKTAGGLRITQNLSDPKKSTKAFTKKSVLDKISKMDSSQQQNLIKSNPGAADRIKATITKSGNQKSVELPKLSRNVTQGAGKGATSNVTGNKDFANFMKNNKISNTTTGNKKVKLPNFGKKSGVTNPSFMKKVTPNVKKALKPTAKAFMKAGPLGKLAAGALVVGGTVYGANQIRKVFAGAGKPKAPPVVKGDALRYNTGPKKGEKKYFDISKMKTKYFTKDDYKDMNPDSKTYGQVDAGFGKPDRDKKLIKKLKSTK